MLCSKYVYNVTQAIKRIRVPHAFSEREEIILPDLNMTSLTENSVINLYGLKLEKTLNLKSL